MLKSRLAFIPKKLQRMHFGQVVALRTHPQKPFTFISGSWDKTFRVSKVFSILVQTCKQIIGSIKCLMIAIHTTVYLISLPVHSTGKLERVCCIIVKIVKYTPLSLILPEGEIVQVYLLGIPYKLASSSM